MKKTSKYSAEDKKITEDLYHYFLQSNQDDGWGDKDKYGNFAKLITLTSYTKSSLEGSTVLDVGCGTGDFSEYLRERNISDYTGLDLVELSIQLAQMKYPSEKFIIGDFLTTSFPSRFDYVFCSGTLAAILDTNNYTMMEAFITKMWKLCSKGVALNFLIQRTPRDHDDTLFLYDVEKVLSLTKKAVPDAKISHELHRAGDHDEFLQAHLFLYR